MENGHPEYGCQTNPSKTKMSFPRNLDENTPPPTPEEGPGKGCMIEQDGSVFFPWCGYLINISRFEFQLDYLRFKGHGNRHCSIKVLISSYT